MNELLDAFAEDHQHVTRGLAALRDAVFRDEWVEAARLADELDRRAGPHIAFEETSFYPFLKTVLGSEFVARLYREHGAVRRALATLQTCGPSGPTAADKAGLVEDLRVGLEHTMSCGTLTSHLRGLDAEEAARMLRRLRELRRRPARWTLVGRTEGPA